MPEGSHAAGLASVLRERLNFPYFLEFGLIAGEISNQFCHFKLGDCILFKGNQDCTGSGV